jgi:hypothetical protein
MKTFQVKIKSSIANRLNYVKDILTITQEDFFYVINGKLLVRVKGANPMFPNNYIDFSTDELVFIDFDYNLK